MLRRAQSRWTRTAVITAASAVALSGLAAANPTTAGAAEAATAAAEPTFLFPDTIPASWPKSGFELRNEGPGYTDWTTEAEEYSFLQTVDELSPRMAYDVVGESTLGRPIHLVRIAAGTPKPLEQLGGTSTALITCTQHGNEEAPRDGCLQLIRNLSFTSDPFWVDYLSKVTVLVMPTNNPDGFAANTFAANGMRTRAVWDRVNAAGNPVAGTDMNRDHLALKTPEARAISTVLSHVTPEIAIDGHELTGASRPDMSILWPRNANVDDKIWQSSKAIADYVLAGALAADFSAEWYPSGGDQRILRNMAGLRGTVSLLLESNRGTLDNSARVDVQQQFFNDALTFHSQNLAEISENVRGFAARQVAAGNANAPIYTGGVVTDGNPAPVSVDPPTAAETMDPAPSCYFLRPEQAEAVADQFEQFGVQTTTVDGRIQVPLAQATRPILPYILDSAGAYETVQAMRMADCAPDVNAIVEMVESYNADGTISDATTEALLYPLTRAKADATRGGEARVMSNLQLFIDRANNRVKGDAADLAARTALVVAAQDLIAVYQAIEDFEDAA
jgi:hypothetical protein